MKRIVLIVLTIGIAGCGYYSFTGATIPAHLETIAIPLVEDRTIGGPAGLNQQMTDLLIDRFAGRTRLTLVSDEEQADAVLYVEITRYTNEPAGVTGGEVAALNRVNIAIAVRYVDQVEENERLERSFTQSETYDAVQIDQELPTAELVLINLADDVFTAATSDW